MRKETKRTGAWHIIDIGEQSPKIVNSIIEVPRGSKNKYEIDKESGFLKLDRTLFSSVHYPANYGFIPKTLSEDGDPLDILILGQEAIYPMTIVSAKPLGVLCMKDQDKLDEKIIAVHNNDPEYRDYTSIDDLPNHRIKEIKDFFENYKELEKKKVEILHILGKVKAHKIIEEANRSYSKSFS